MYEIMHDDNSPNCRICLEGGGNMISPCNCDGSMKYVHAECITTWVATGKDTCEICDYTFETIQPKQPWFIRNRSSPCKLYIYALILTIIIDTVLYNFNIIDKYIYSLPIDVRGVIYYLFSIWILIILTIIYIIGGACITKIFKRYITLVRSELYIVLLVGTILFIYMQQWFLTIGVSEIILYDIIRSHQEYISTLHNEGVIVLNKSGRGKICDKSQNVYDII